MLAWSPILVRQIEIQALGFVLRKLQLNRHRDAEVATHAHPFNQLILYLGGEGIQVVNGQRRRAEPGDLFLIPAGTPHGFAAARGSRPLCLALDFETRETARSRVAHRRLPPATLNELHALLATVPAKGRATLADYATILAVVARLLGPERTADGPPRRPSLYERVAPLLHPAGGSLAALARRTGFHPDHLTRRLKRETGLGLRALRNRQRLAAAQKALLAMPAVADAAAAAGFEDANYFARWFRRQAGLSPRAWRAAQER